MFRADEPEESGVEVDTFRGKDFDGWMALIIKVRPFRGLIPSA